jgi:hypothetical protein
MKQTYLCNIQNYWPNNANWAGTNSLLTHISLQWAKQQDKYLKFRQNKLKGLSGPKWAKASHVNNHHQPMDQASIG